MAPGTIIRASMVFGGSSAATASSTNLSVTLTVGDLPVQTAEPEPSKMARLRWLDSTLYTHDYGLVPPYTAVIFDGGNTLAILNREIVIGNGSDLDGAATTAGLPARITVTRAASRHGTLPAKSIELLSAPVRLELVGGGGVPLSPVGRSSSPGPVAGCTQGPPKFTTNGEGLVSWYAAIGYHSPASSSEGGGVCVGVRMSITMEGLVSGSVTLAATADQVSLSDIRLTVALAKQHGLSWMGLDARGQSGAEDGGLSLGKGDIAWTWKTNSKSNQLFVGSAVAGLKLRPRGNTTEWLSPIERFYDEGMILPDEWGANNGRGGINASATKAGGATVVIFTGPQTVGASSSSSSTGPLTLNLELTVTPFKTPNETQHWSLRHFQVGYPGSAFTSAADVKKTGANVINIHQGVATMINPYINYPFVGESVALLANYTAEANALGMRVKFYYTVRELTNHAAEIFALRMLGDEVYAQGDGDGDGCGYDSGTECKASTAWQRLHLGGNFSSAWTCPLSNGEYDAAIRQNKLAGATASTSFFKNIFSSCLAPHAPWCSAKVPLPIGCWLGLVIRWCARRFRALAELLHRGAPAERSRAAPHSGGTATSTTFFCCFFGTIFPHISALQHATTTTTTNMPCRDPLRAQACRMLMLIGACNSMQFDAIRCWA